MVSNKMWCSVAAQARRGVSDVADERSNAVREIALEKTKGTKLTARTALVAGKLRLPPGYYVELDAELMELRRADGSLVAAFSARGAVPAAVLQAAAEDHGREGAKAPEENTSRYPRGA